MSYTPTWQPTVAAGVGLVPGASQAGAGFGQQRQTHTLKQQTKPTLCFGSRRPASRHTQTRKDTHTHTCSHPLPPKASRLTGKPRETVLMPV